MPGSAATRPWRQVVFAVAVASAVAGGALEAVLVLRLDELFLAIAEPFFWPSAHPPHALSEDARLGQAIGFGFWAGISVTQAWLVRRLEDEPLRPVARALLAGHLVWYVLDSAGSAAAGAWLNVITNSVYGVVMGVALFRLGRAPARGGDR